MGRTKEQGQRLEAAGKLHREYRDEIREIQAFDAEMGYLGHKDFLRRCGAEEPSMGRTKEQAQRLKAAGKVYREYRAEIREIQALDAEMGYLKHKDFLRRCGAEEARRSEAGLCPSCGQTRQPEDENDITTWFFAPFSF